MIDFYEAIELFVNTTMPLIKSECEIPNINFLFDHEALEVIYYVYHHPFRKKDYWTPDIDEFDLELISLKNNCNPDTETIHIHGKKFFELLTSLTNKYIEFLGKLNIHIGARNSFMNFSKRIFLRMSDSDFKDIDSFLERQIRFLENEDFLEYKDEKQISFYDGYYVYAKLSANNSFDESSRNLSFYIKSGDKKHALSSVYYDIDTINGEKVCYIYAVQKKEKDKIKSIERSLYKLNEGITNPNVHPNQVLALMLFLKELEKKGIRDIRVPLKQTLNYKYHQIMSEKEKERFSLKWMSVIQNNTFTSELQKEEFEYEKEFYEHVVDKADFIQELKTTKLFNLVRRITYHMPGFKEVLSDEEDVLKFTLK